MIGPLLLLLALGTGPVPDGAAIKPRMLAGWHRSEKALENYSCIVHEQTDELNSDGSLKKSSSSVKEQFFVNGIEIDHTLERDGKPLSPSEAKKEQERVDKQVRKFSDKERAEKAKSAREKQIDLFLRALRFMNGRREQRDGRSTLHYDAAGDPNFRPKNLLERFAQIVTGYVKVDEESGTPVEMRFETRRDMKFGAGVLGNLHKGFWIHSVEQREPDGVWITKSLAVSGDARQLFRRSGLRFSQQLEKCHLFSVETQEKIGQTPSPRP